MNPNVIVNHKSIVSACKLSSFLATSARKPDDSCPSPNAPTHALSADHKSASLPAVDFDAVKNILYLNTTGNMPCSVDAATLSASPFRLKLIRALTRCLSQSTLLLKCLN